ncbi:hypothetical protein AIOGIFDO_00440 [Candidatus Methanoperedenaceae archaeon GB37]|nr:hypothetical protein AIOGIFDO_00440 [Candidatus Methanoperedenaceae archaeon GB37]
MRRRLIYLILVLLFLFLSSAGGVSAHRLHIHHQIGAIEIKAYYGGGTPCRDANVTIYDDEGNLYMEGVTDESGEFSFPPKIGVDEYRVVVESTHMVGHRGETTINMSSSGGGGAGAAGGAGEEMPLYVRIAAGLGYLLALGGAAAAYSGWKMKKRYGGG